MFRQLLLITAGLIVLTTPPALAQGRWVGGPGGSPTAAAERMLGARASRGGAAVRVSRLGSSGTGACNGAVGGTIYEITITNTPTGWEEDFLLGVPHYPESGAAPLLVGFHKFEVSHWDLCEHTDFFNEAFSRGWFIVTPLGAAQQAFGGLEAQANTQLVLDFCSILPVDPARIYGVGFSTGGGWMTSYAARHQDPTRSRFAGLVNHTGGVSLTHTYANEEQFDNGCDPPFPACPGACPCANNPCDWEAADMLEYFYAGPPGPDPFAYLRCSLFDLQDGPPATIDAHTDMAGNLLYTPLRTSYATNDITSVGLYLAAQCQALDNHLSTTLGGLEHTLVPLAASVHSWTTLDEALACDFLDSQAPAAPAGFRIVTADRDGRWNDMTVIQDPPPLAPGPDMDWRCGSLDNEPGHFARFDWGVDVANNIFSLRSTRQLASLRVHSRDMGLEPTQPLQFYLLRGPDTDGGPLQDEVVITDFSSAPTSVTVGNTVQVPGVDYTWEAATGLLTLVPRSWPTNGFLHWTITP